jgi:ketosteroid isomerase-like protein
MTDPRGWAETIFRLVDRFDADAMAARMAPDGVLISVNNDPVVGRDGMRAAVHAFEQAVTSISHQVLRAWRADDTVITELRVTYVRHDGRKVVLPCTNIFDLTDDGLISRYQIFMDMTPVFA